MFDYNRKNGALNKDIQTLMDGIEIRNFDELGILPQKGSKLVVRRGCC